jgi:glyceraldehyde-3-phosphate dehydrogenase (NADP+)
MSLATESDHETALSQAANDFQSFRKISRHTRSRLLAAMARGIEERRSEIVERMVQEAGKPRQLSDVEVSRAISTFSTAAEEAKRIGGEIVPVDVDSGGRAYSEAISYWVPRGPVLAISPFNFPLNLAAHKVAPALAAGATVILKPPHQAPGAGMILGEIFLKAASEASDSSEKIPLGAFQVLNASNEIIGRAVKDSRIGTLSFTGSGPVGWMLQAQAVRKRVLLELGGIAGVIIHSDADLKRAAARCAYGSFSYAGQICISVQRIFVHESVIDDFQTLLLQETAKLKVGDPNDPGTLVGPLIDSGAANRIQGWLEEAQANGAKLLVGGERKGNVITPAVISDVRSGMKLSSEEVFGPVVLLDSYSSFSDAVQQANQTRFGLQAGVFTDRASLIREAVRDLEFGAVIVNEIPTFRADNMPYGGVKESGLGREGVRYAIEEYCERRTLVSWHG